MSRLNGKVGPEDRSRAGIREVCAYRKRQNRNDLATVGFNLDRISCTVNPSHEDPIIAVVKGKYPVGRQSPHPYLLNESFQVELFSFTLLLLEEMSIYIYI